MKSTKHLLLIIIALISLNVNAQEAPPVIINVATAGTLPELIPSSKKNQITNLTLTGFLNGTDIRFIREMAGRDGIEQLTIGSLSVLDLSNAHIVAGGGSYYYNSSGLLYSSLNSIGDGTFSGCSRLTSLTIPESITTIGRGAFSGCSGLTSLIIPNGVTTIGMNAFSFCSGLTSVIIPNGVTTIGIGAFQQCTKLSSVVIPNNVTSIGIGDFYGCSELTSITIPNSVTTIGESAFYDCTKLTSATISSNVTTIGEFAFFHCSALSSLTIPNSVTTIFQYAFSSCSGLTSLTIPNGVTTIWDFAFSYCSGLTSLTISESVTTIGEAAFYDCNQIKQIYCKGTIPPKTEFDPFPDSLHNTCVLYVPIGSYSVYQADPHWGKFTNIIEQVTTSISDCEASNTNVYSENGYIVVKGGKLGDIINIYSVTGSLLHKIKITDDIVRISVAPQSLYIVKTGDRSFKIAL